MGFRVRSKALPPRVARWYIFKPKNTYFGKIWRALEWKMSFGIQNAHLVYFIAIR
jgi:hypothetical protein